MDTHQINYHKINYTAMCDTQGMYRSDEGLKQMVSDSVNRQFMVSQEENIDQPQESDAETAYSVTGGRTFTEAQPWARKGCKVAVLNFANNHSVGGAPFSAGAQEESLCRCSTLYPCLEAMRKPFYQKHQDDFTQGKLDYMGNDDLIYTPDVCVFKDDRQNAPGDLIIPRLMPREEWYKVDVITCAAPQLMHGAKIPSDYEAQICRRIKKILDVAKQQGAEVLILGAWGCGAFRNPVDVMARAFHSQLKNYAFRQVIFAMGRGDYQTSPFYKEFCS